VTLLGDSKFQSILELLETNITVFYFDLDIFFRRSPFPLRVKDEIEMYAQSNGYSLEPYNFGCFLVRPTKKNLEVYKKSLELFLENPSAFDQGIWNKWILSVDLPSHKFAKDEYYSVSDRREDYIYPEISKNFVMAHITCVEGQFVSFCIHRF
jgi:hypothetical protein